MVSEQSVERHIKALWDKDENVRDQAVEALGAIGEPAVPALLVALRKDDRNHDLQYYENPDIRRAIIAVGEPAFQALIVALGPESDMVRAAAKTLQLFSDLRAVEPLIDAMLDERVNLNGRLYAIGALGEFKAPRAFEPLKTALSDKNVYIRSHAARALAEYGDVSVAPMIREALSDQEYWWRHLREGLSQVLKVLYGRKGGGVDGLRGGRAQNPAHWRS